MPHSSPRPCRDNRAHLTKAKDGLCDPCRSKRNASYKALRHGGPADDAYYHSPEWTQLRAEHLILEPLCRRCLPRPVAGYGCHHIIERHLGGPDAHSNLETLCKAHLTGADLRGVVARQGR